MAAFDLPFPPFPHDSRDVPFIAVPDDNNGYAVPSSQYFKKLVGEKYLWTPVSSDDPMPSSDVAAQAQLAEILAKLSADPATQTTLAQILAKIISAPSTEAKQISLEAKIDIIDAVLDTLVAKDFATQTTLATLLTQSGYEAKADIALTVLRDAILGSSSKTLTDIVTILAGILTAKIDQTTDGTTNRVVAKISQTAGENLVQLSGSKMEVYGTSLDDRPDATTVPIGATFTIVDATRNYDSWISDGLIWLEV